MSGGTKDKDDDDTISLHLDDTEDDPTSPPGSPGARKGASSCDTQEDEEMDVGDAAANLGIVNWIGNTLVLITSSNTQLFQQI